jgi:hypothetical protein
LGNTVPNRIIYDPSAASLKVQLHKDGFMGLTAASNEVIDGVRTQARMLKDGHYAIVDNGETKHTIQDYSGYVWDERAQLRGEDKPLKNGNDHTKDMERYVLYTLYGDKVLDYERLTQW